MQDVVIPDLDRKGLREFGIVTGAIVAGLFGVFFPWLLDHSVPFWPWIVCAVLAVWGLVAPLSLRPIYRAWMRFGHIMGTIMTPVIMGLLFFVLISPMAIGRKLLGKDSMRGKFDSNASSYRVVSKQPSVNNLERPF
jgi:Saxitoxin biosynthesis operon protein SxtJ